MATDTNEVASLGQNIQFVAACAHFFAAAYAISHLPIHLRIYAACAVTVAAAIKEFWFDAKYEKNPPQTFMDNLQDFASWTAGAWMGVLG